jgi:diguanylate cyclase
VKPRKRGQASATRPPLSLLDQCLDSFAAVLRAWGDHPIELPDRSPEQTRSTCEGWARHLLLATPPPGQERALPDAARDWIALERAFRSLRQGEYNHVTRSLAELRQVVWVCVQALSKASVAEARSDSKVGERLPTLRAAAQGGDIEILRREVTSVVSLLESEIEARRARQQSQIEHLTSQLDHLTATLITEREIREKDALTGVHGRAAMDEHLANLCQMGQVVHPTAIAFLIDVDHFKWVNDRFGHPAGDEVLKRVAQCLLAQFRRRDDFVARYGGDEFVAVVEGCDLEIAANMAERVLFAVRELEVEQADEKVRVAISMGIAALRRGESPREWIDRADKALYASKHAGRDRVSIAESP